MSDFNWDPIYGPWHVALCGSVWLHFAISTTLFLRRRSSFPICGQEVTIALLGVFSILLDASTTALTGTNSGEPVDCITTFFTFVLLTLAMNCYIARAWRLWFEFYATDERIRGFRSNPTTGQHTHAHDEEHEQEGSRSERNMVNHTIEITSLEGDRDMNEVKTDEGDLVSAGANGRPRRRGSASASASASVSTSQFNGGGGDVSPSGQFYRESLSQSVIEKHSRVALVHRRRSHTSSVSEHDGPHAVELREAHALRRDSIAQTWFAEHRRWAHTDRLLAMVGVVTVVELVAPIAALIGVTVGGKDSDSDSDVACPEYDLASLIWTAIFLAAVLFVVYTIYRLRHVHDGFYIKMQLRNMIFWGILGTLMSVVTVQDVGGQSKILRVVQGVVSHLYVWESITLPVYLSFRDQRTRKQFNAVYSSPPSQEASVISLPSVSRVPDFSTMFDSDEELVSTMARIPHIPERKVGMPEDILPPNKDPNLKDIRLRDVLQNKALLREFAGHLKKEFSIENLLFYYVAGEFQYACEHGDRFESVEERNREALHVYSMFICDDGFYQVNLDAGSFKTMLQDLESHMPNTDVNSLASDVAMYRAAPDHTPVSGTLYERGRKKIFVLMQRDSFVRFKKKLPPEKRYIPRTRADKEAVADNT